jgi:broad specificity phosphatase PhoE
MKKVYFVRHGETDSNQLRYVPSKDEPINQRGLLQAETFARRIENLDVDLFIASDYTRALQTLQPIIDKNKAPLRIEAVFGEVFDPTSIHGKPDVDQCVVDYRVKRDAGLVDDTWRQEDGENLHDVFERILVAKSVLEKEESQNIVVMTHGFFSSLLSSAILLSADKPTETWYELAQKLRISNTGITLWTIADERQWNLVTWNDHAHFADN